MTAPRDKVAWPAQAGFDVFWPFAGPLASSGLFADLPDVFGRFAAGPWDLHVTSEVYDQCHAIGCDHFRVQINPGPWLQAIADNNATYLEGLNELLDTCLENSKAAGMPLMLSNIFTGYPGPTNDVTTILQGTDSEPYQQYRQLMTSWGTRWGGSFDPNFLSFDLLNEPPFPATFPASWPDEIMPDLYRAMRAVVPLHTLAGSGVSYSGIDNPEGGLINIDPSGYDLNTIWMIHPFVPNPAAQTNYPYNQFKYISAIQFPPDSREQAAVTAQTKANVYADPTLTQAEADNIWNTQLTPALEAYWGTPQDQTYISGEFDKVTAWCEQWNLPASLIYASEMGATRRNVGFPTIGIPGSTGTTRPNRIRYLTAINTVCLQHGFRRAYDHLDTLDYGLTLAQNSDIGPFDPLLARAICLERKLLKY